MLISLSEALYKVAVQKTIRCRKDHMGKMSRLSSVASDPSWTPDSGNYKRVTAPLDQIQLQCFAPSDGPHDHLDASTLQKLGIWLGDYNDDKKVVTELSYRDVRRQYFESTDGGENRDIQKSLQPNSAHTLESDKAMDCAACRSVGRESASGMVTEHAEFKHLNMSRTVNST